MSLKCQRLFFSSKYLYSQWKCRNLLEFVCITFCFNGSLISDSFLHQILLFPIKLFNIHGGSTIQKTIWSFIKHPFTFFPVLLEYCPSSAFQYSGSFGHLFVFMCLIFRMSFPHNSHWNTHSFLTEMHLQRCFWRFHKSWDSCMLKSL